MPKSTVNKSRILAQFRSPKSKHSADSKPRFKPQADQRYTEAPDLRPQGLIGELISTRSAMLKTSGPPNDAIVTTAPGNKVKWNDYVDVCDSNFYIALDTSTKRDFCYCYGPGVYIYCKQFLS